MNKKFSLVSLIAMTIFMVAIFATSTGQTNFGEADKFGFPFTFFTASINGEAITDTNFSLVALFGDLSICFLIGFAIVSALSLLKVEKKKAMIA